MDVDDDVEPGDQDDYAIQNQLQQEASNSLSRTMSPASPPRQNGWGSFFGWGGAGASMKSPVSRAQNDNDDEFHDAESDDEEDPWSLSVPRRGRRKEEEEEEERRTVVEEEEIPVVEVVEEEVKVPTPVPTPPHRTGLLIFVMMILILLDLASDLP